MVDIRMTTLGGKSMLYDRAVPSHYGKTGSVFRPFMNPDFAQQCDACFTEMFRQFRTHLNLEVDKILSGGVSRAGSGTSLHHKNRAFDLDALLFANETSWVATSFPTRPHIYLGMEAILRRHFGTVLTFGYNKPHEDHFHFDNGTAIGFKKDAKSHVLFVQNVLKFVYHMPVGVDGLWGGETEGALRKLLGELKISAGLANREKWLEFLAIVAADAFELEKGLLS